VTVARSKGVTWHRDPTNSAQAEECRKLAKRFRDLGRVQYEDLARQWLELAERAERQSAAARAQDGSVRGQG
jgi:hypothetical protein